MTKHHAQLQDQTGALTGNLNTVYACESWTPSADNDSDNGDEMLQQAPWHLMQR